MQSILLENSNDFCSTACPSDSGQRIALAFIKLLLSVERPHNYHDRKAEYYLNVESISFIEQEASPKAWAKRAAAAYTSEDVSQAFV